MNVSQLSLLLPLACVVACNSAVQPDGAGVRKTAGPEDGAEPLIDAADSAPPEVTSLPSPGKPTIGPPTAKAENSKILRDHFAVSDNAIEGLRAFADALPQKGTLWIGQLKGNGGRDVVIYIPSVARDDAPVELVFHFHGTYSENIAKPQDGVPKKSWVGWDRLEQTMLAIADLGRGDPRNFVLVYPISSGKRLEPGHRGWSNKMYDRMWMKRAKEPGYRDSFDQLHREAVAVITTELGVHPSRVNTGVIAEGHSAGGIALKNIAEVGTDLVEEYIFLDASFETWADGVYRAVTAQGSSTLVTIVLTDGGIADPYGKHDPWCVKRPLDAAAWKKSQAWCGEDLGRSPAGSKKTCEQLRDAAADWELERDWCEALKLDDLSTYRSVYLHRTKVPHGKQPRHFSGGLELPADRFDAAATP